MKISEYKLFLWIFIILSSITFVASMEISEYEYISKIRVNCEEYKGYARFELPDEYNFLESQRSYLDIEHFIHKIRDQDHYVRIDNWFVKQIESHSIGEVEKIFDNNYETYLIEENKNQIDFIFELPTSSKVDKISIDLRDSSIEELKIYNNLGDEVSYSRKVENFHYEFFLNEPVYTNQLRFVIDYKDIIKIKEVVFFNLKPYEEKSYAYIYVDNDCMKEHTFYFGRYGEDNSKMGSKSLPVEFYIGIETFRNSFYNSDFDNDTIPNDDDNCLSVSNKDQKDINYNNKGDACEDDDNDGVVNLIDNCIDKPNRDQLDNDNDGIGNVCDESDGRFFEKNKYLVFILAGIIAIIFLIVAVIVMRNN